MEYLTIPATVHASCGFFGAVILPDIWEFSTNQDASRAYPVALAQDQHIESSEVVGFGAEMEHCSNRFGILVATVLQL